MVEFQDIRVNDQLGLPLPPTLIGAQSNEALVVNDRSFFDSDKALESFTANDDRPRIPVNPNTGLSYPIILTRAPGRYVKTTRHHHNFPDSFLMGHALRHVYVQKVPASLHNDGPRAIHAQFSIPHELPDNNDDVLGTVLMGLAAHLPHEGLDLSRSEPKVRCLTRKEEGILRNPGMWGLTAVQNQIEAIPTIHMAWRSAATRRLPVAGEVSPLQRYSCRMVMSAIGHIDNFSKRSRIFEQTTHPEVGFEMLRDAARILVENTLFRGETLSDKYMREWRSGRLRADSPRDAGDLLIGALGTRGGLGVAFQELKEVTRQARATRQDTLAVA